MPPMMKQAPPDNAMLQQYEQAIEAKLDPQVRGYYQRIVLAGMKSAMANNGAMMAKLPQSQDPVRDCALGAVNVTFLMIKTMNVPLTEHLATAITAAAYTLTMQALDMAAKMKLVKITPQIIASATSTATDRVFQLIHVTPQMLNNAAQRVHAITQDPKSMEQIELKIGSKRDPRAALPTPGFEHDDTQEATNGNA